MSDSDYIPYKNFLSEHYNLVVDGLKAGNKCSYDSDNPLLKPVTTRNYKMVQGFIEQQGQQSSTNLEDDYTRQQLKMAYTKNFKAQCAVCFSFKPTRQALESHVKCTKGEQHVYKQKLDLFKDWTSFGSDKKHICLIHGCDWRSNNPDGVLLHYKVHDYIQLAQIGICYPLYLGFHPHPSRRHEQLATHGEVLKNLRRKRLHCEQQSVQEEELLADYSHCYTRQKIEQSVNSTNSVTNLFFMQPPTNATPQLTTRDQVIAITPKPGLSESGSLFQTPCTPAKEPLLETARKSQSEQQRAEPSQGLLTNTLLQKDQVSAVAELLSQKILQSLDPFRIHQLGLDRFSVYNSFEYKSNVEMKYSDSFSGYYHSNKRPDYPTQYPHAWPNSNEPHLYHLMSNDAHEQAEFSEVDRMSWLLHHRIVHTHLKMNHYWSHFIPRQVILCDDPSHKGRMTLEAVLNKNQVGLIAFCRSLPVAALIHFRFFTRKIINAVYNSQVWLPFLSTEFIFCDWNDIKHWYLVNWQDVDISNIRQENRAAQGKFSRKMQGSIHRWQTKFQLIWILLDLVYIATTPNIYTPVGNQVGIDYSKLPSKTWKFGGCPQYQKEVDEFKAGEVILGRVPKDPDYTQFENLTLAQCLFKYNEFQDHLISDKELMFLINTFRPRLVHGHPDDLRQQLFENIQNEVPTQKECETISQFITTDARDPAQDQAQKQNTEDIARTNDHTDAGKVPVQTNGKA